MNYFSGLARLVGGYFKLRVMLIIFIIFIINAVVISIDNQDYTEGFKYLGEKISKPLFELQDESIKIIENGGIYKDTGEKGTLFTYIGVFWKIFSSLYVVYLWLFIISKIVLAVVGSNVPFLSRTIFITIPLYILLQIIWLLIIDESPMQIIYAFRDLGKAFPYIIKSLANNGEIFLKTSPENIAKGVINNTK